MDTIVLRSQDFGIKPNTQEDAAPALRKLITAAANYNSTVIQLEAGDYLLDQDTDRIMLEFWENHDITIRGSVDKNNEPCTCLKIKLPLENDTAAKGFFAVRRSKNITLENLVFDYTHRPSSVGRIVEADVERNRVVVDVLEGQSHFDHMKCYSANCWDLRTGSLKHTHPLTIGVDKKTFAHEWTWIPGGEGRRYEIWDMNFAHLVQPDDGMSWHFNVIGVGEDKPHVIIASNSENLVLRNLRIRSCIGMTGIFVCNHHITMQQIRVEADGTSLAVSPRDFAWMRCNSGKLLIEDCYVKGVRWDPFNIWSGMYPITNISKDRKQITFEMLHKYQTFCKTGQTICFWTDDGAIDIPFNNIELVEGGFVLSFEQPIDNQIQIGAYLTPSWVIFDEVLMRNTTVEDNCGTGLLFQNQNLIVEHCSFNNNSYDAIALGPISGREGSFARNVVIRDTDFVTNTWINKAAIHDGSISICNGFGPLLDKPYNQNISVIGNRFRDCDVAISIRNAQNIQISDNEMKGVGKEIAIGCPKDQPGDDY